MKKRVLATALMALAGPAVAAEDGLVVHILCDTDRGQVRGSGVVVSADGRVLTAAHVMPDGATRTAGLGTTEGLRVPLLRERVAEGFDAALARLETGTAFARFATVCPPELEAEITSAGYHSRMTGAPARKEGIVSTLKIERGTIEMTAPVIPAESGGPVFLRGTTALVGIVAGADFDASTGLPTRRMVPVAALAGFGLTPAADCRALSPEAKELTAGLAESNEKLDRLLALAQASEEARRMAEVGITPEALIALAGNRSANVEELEDAWAELQSAMQIAVRLQEEGRAGANLGDFVDEVLRRTADLSAQGDYDAAAAEIDAALAREEADSKGRIRLLDTGIEIDLLRRDAESAARRLVQRADLDAGGEAAFEDLLALGEEWSVRGRDKGLALDQEVGIALARLVLARANGPDERGAVLYGLGLSLLARGERETDTARLEEAVDPLRATLEEWTRGRVPLQWAMTQGNLAIAEIAFFDKTGDPAHLDRATAHNDSSTEVFAEANATAYLEIPDLIRAEIAARRPPRAAPDD